MLGGLALFCTFAVAVGLQAQRVAGQADLDALSVRHHLASIEQIELRAAVATAESPAEVLTAAGEIGMVEPAAVAVVPSPGPTHGSAESPLVPRTGTPLG